MLIDGHAHLHACHDVGAALDAAWANLATRRGESVPRPDAAAFAGTLWVVETRGEGAAARLRDLRDDRWRRTERDEATWELRRADGAGLLVVLGRQIRTAEDLEVLVVGTREPAEDDLPLETTVRTWLDRDALVMIPWGLGKWSAGRGRAVERAWEAWGADGLHLADTGLRTRWLPEPGLFERSRSEGRPVLVGSDPPPFADRLEAIGSTGFVLPGLPPDAVWPAMRRALAGLEPPVERFGRPLGTIDFVALQAKMQVRKRLGGR